MPLNPVNNGDSGSAARATINAAITQVNTNTADIAGKQPLDSDLTAIAALTPSNDDSIFRVAGAWLNRTPTQAKAILAIGISDVATLQTELDNKQDEGGIDTTIWRVTGTAIDVNIAVGDNKKKFIITNGGATLFNVPLNSSQAFAVGTEIGILNTTASAGNVTVTPAGGVTIGFVNGASLVMAPQTGAHLLKIATDEWILQY